ncbi:hypothetical protein BT96DRAFT_915909 [Gymnopus androsaceus JB14]|uniref:F-box domain-containing protein n=1 Tax=Gymnopus androsaceus JB14 TaxID=1447944 RepID=A0A6A4I6Y1_9AGAR|nr:hypothetical protein BT96DRAFT_915909 [Gymnopus androsaceus JB14]
MVKLPNELVGYILDNLYFDRDALLNCALVGRAWVYSSQRGIFRQIVLDLTSVHMWSIYLEMTERLISSFDANPSLASYVRSFKLLTAATANIVHRLANLNVEKVALDLDEWNGVSPSLKEALVNMLRAHSVTRLSLTRFLITFKDLASLLSHMPHLKVLDLGIFFQDWDVPNSSLESNVEGAVASTAHCPPRSIQLHQLRLASENELISFATWFQQDWCPFAVGNLKLCIICTVYSEAAIDMLKLQQLGTKVRELKLPGQESHSTPAAFILGTLPIFIV